MRIREYNSSDLESLRAMHAAQGFGYPLPNLESPLFVSKLVLEDDDLKDVEWEDDERNNAEHATQFNRADLAEAACRNDSVCEGREARTSNSPRVVMAILTRVTAETYLLHDPAEGSPRRRWERFLMLHDAARHAAAGCGLDDVQAFLPPVVARAFGRRLERLGWTRDPWPCFSLRVP